jgi:hypothetical protein
VLGRGHFLVDIDPSEGTLETVRGGPFAVRVRLG